MIFYCVKQWHVFHCSTSLVCGLLVKGQQHNSVFFLPSVVVAEDHDADSDDTCEYNSNCDYYY